MTRRARSPEGIRKLPREAVVAVLSSGGPKTILDRELQELRGWGLGAVEVRGDLFASAEEALGCMRDVTPDLPRVFTVRHSSQGGGFRGSEEDRAALYQAGIEAGADWLDVEWGTPAARDLAEAGAPLILSHHDFAGTPARSELDRLADGMTGMPCAAIKLVPTARSLSDSLSILDWVAARKPDDPPRIGFAMGEAGFASRVLALSRGSPFTYAGLEGAVAPGQVSARELLSVYRPQARSRATRVLGVAGNPVRHSLSPHLHNPVLTARGIDAVYLPFLLDRLEDLLPAAEPLGIAGLSVTIPFKEEALRLADQADARSRAAGAANTWRIERGADGKRKAIHAFNTDLDGVLDPLRRRVGDLRGLEAAVIGNGGAARGATRALLEAGASPTLYYRNPARGDPVARSLGVAGRPLSALKRGGQRLVLNATPLGLKPGDGSPVDPAVFTAETIAFEMVYDPPETRFLLDAAAAGSTVIAGREMLVSQAREQFRIFTGQTPSYEELDGNFQAGQALRRAAR